jgi:hypothetical protein
MVRFMPRPRTPGSKVVRTTLTMPTALWRRAKVRAMDEGRDLRDVLLDALRAYLRRERREKRHGR